ncbi:unnamed protein product [Polarella glacialis]|uniref:Gustatory receptor n=1 Tax=Polarella glacialis TaxID=89957 RepID=A0A813FPX4_POLGL|nr:unnamed protein product [Polarella glacialis]
MLLYTTVILCCIGGSMFIQLWQLRNPGSQEGRFSDEVILVMAFCSAVGFLQLKFCIPGQDSAMQSTSAMLMDRDMLPKYVDLWLKRSRWSSWEAAFLWFLSVAAETAVVLWSSGRDESDSRQAAGRLLAFAVAAGTYSALSLYPLHISNAQAAMIDHYSSSFVERSADYCKLRQDWDKIQAILRRSAQSLTPCLLMLTLTPVIVVKLCAFELLLASECDARRMLLELLPKMIVHLGILRGLCRIGEVIGNRNRLTVFLNSLLLGDGFDEEASRLILFIERSQAGFYMFDAKVGFSAMSKVAYVIIAGLLALLSQAVHLE